ncbi:MAG TPA: cupin domain-containing protein [Methylomirabilota bacterium]|nr:cupin domain-containing protein [Methylomirabilota bacterium]
MPTGSNADWRFVSLKDAEVEELPGKTHYWYTKPGMVKDTNLLFVRAQLPPGEAHRFHYHPHMEEILYILSGTAEQWVKEEKRILGPGDSIYLAAGIIHGTYNIGPDTLDFLAILSPAKTPAPGTIEVSDQEPWKSLRR